MSDYIQQTPEVSALVSDLRKAYYHSNGKVPKLYVTKEQYELLYARANYVDSVMDVLLERVPNRDKDKTLYFRGIPIVASDSLEE